MNSRLIKILQQLYSIQEPMTSTYLAAILQVSYKTIQNDIKELNQILEKANARIDSQRGIGYQLLIEDEIAFFQHFQTYVREINKITPSTSEERIHFLIEKLLLQSNYIKIEDLANEIYVSRSTLQGDLKEVRGIMEKYNLQLDQKPNYGIKVIGSEINIRFCISQYVLHQNSNLMDINQDWLGICSQGQLEIIKNSILANLRKNRIIISDISLHNLITHIIIACKRLQEKNMVEIHIDDLLDMQNKKEYQVAKEIVKSIESHLNIRFPESEIAYISIHLQGTKLVNPRVKKTELNNVIDEEISQMANIIMQSIDYYYKFNLQKDNEFIMALCLHLKPAINRFKFKMNLRNPLLEEIKTKYPLSFEAALIGADALKEHYHIEFDENEIGYIALHIEVAQERQKKKESQIPKCLIVCASGLGTAQLLLYKLKNRFGNELDILGTTEYYNLDQQLLENIDFIISTIPIKDDLGVPVVLVSTILGDMDVRNIEKLMVNDVSIIHQYLREEFTFLQMSFENRNEVIHFLGEKLIRAGKVNHDYIFSVLQREGFSSTSFGNLVAIPHPIEPQTEETFWSIVTLNKPIQWGNKPVQFICLLNISKHQHDELKPMYSVLVKLLDNINLVKNMLRCESFEELKSVCR